MMIEQAPRRENSLSGTILEMHPLRTQASYEHELGQRRSTEARLRELIADDETLLRLKDAQLQQQETLIQQQKLLTSECNHRLMNDLQMIVSFLLLQSRKTSNSEAASQLGAAASRVATIERIHRRLHCLEGDQKIAFKHYLEEFCVEFSAMLSSSGQVITVEGVEMDLPAATAVPLGFVVNELITNAVKHGNGPIVVELEGKPAEGYALSVCNDGPALPEGFDPAASKKLGMKIVRSFVEKIGGQLVMGRSHENQGAKFSVLFS